MFRINPKQYNDRPTPTNINKNYEWTFTTNQPKRIQQELVTKDQIIRKQNKENSPIPKNKAKQNQAYVNPSYRSTNFNKPNTEQNKQQVYASQQFKVDKPMKQDYSLQEMPVLTKESTLPYYEPTKCSQNRNGIIKAYAANTNQGIVRDYNEDRVSIILNIVKPQSRNNETWPKCSFFGVYDGHGGAICADFLRDNLHQFVIKELDFPWNPYEALRKGFEAAEKSFLELALMSYSKGHAERSGSCAIVSLIVGDICYIANVGDSRAVMSAQSGRQVYTLSRDHKPCDELEQERIQQGGGKIYQTQALSSSDEDAEIILGPLRVFPGRLSVSRTFGDIEAKMEQFGGNPNVVVAEPEIKSFKIQAEHDFIVLASDGIFDKMSSADVLRTIWDDLNSSTHNQGQNLHAQISEAVEAVLKESINRRTFDNITVVMVAFTKEEDQRCKTHSSIERVQLMDTKTPTPTQYNRVVPKREEKQQPQLRAQQQFKTVLNPSKPVQSLRSSLETIDYNQVKKFSLIKQKDQKKINEGIKENIPYTVSKTKQKTIDLKSSNDFHQIQRPNLKDYSNFHGVLF